MGPRAGARGPRPLERPPLRTGNEPTFRYGEPDPFGIVGESELAWQLRDALAFAAATDRRDQLSPELLKSDFLARFTHRIALPGLTERRDDVPLILAAILRRTARDNPGIAARFFERRAARQ